MKIAHIINVIDLKNLPKDSDLHVAQAITIKSMIEAKNHTSHDVELYAVKHKDETVSVPKEFSMAEDLQRYCYDVIKELPKERKLPLIGDIINSLYDSSDADYFIYTNVDIGLVPEFYDYVAESLQSGTQVMFINRRTMPKQVDNEPVDENNYKKLFEMRGEYHPGKDCLSEKYS